MILGTAGHIDHGKTALVRALTGVDTDRLPEEKQRGITIELGFAPLTLDGVGTLGVVDVPGHEAFVRTMLAGAAGVDLALLVVAADEGVMPQTREHLAILDVLGIRGGVVALTKCDLVDGDLLALAIDDVRGVLASSGLRDAEIIAVSSVTGQGIPDLREALRRAAMGVPARDARDVFRMPVDRVFTVKGTGTVVTGTVWSGQVTRDTVLAAWPGGTTSRVRGIEVHGGSVDAGQAGQRVAIAVAGFDRESLARGAVLVDERDGWQPAQRLRADVALLDDAAITLTSRTRVRLHLGTTDVGARIVSRGGPLGPGETRPVRLVLDAPVVARGGDRFVLRSASPAATIGGGIITDPAPMHRRVLPFAVANAEPAPRLQWMVDESAAHGLALTGLALRLGVHPDALPRIIDELSAESAVVEGRLVLRSRLDQSRRLLLDAVDAAHRARPLDRGTPLQPIRARLAVVDALADWVVRDAIDRGEIAVVDGLAMRAGWTPQFSPADREAMTRISATLRDAGVEGPSLDELAAIAGPRTPALVRLMEREGQVVAIGEQRFLDVAAMRRVLRDLRAKTLERRIYAAAEVREIFGISRKFAIPLLEGLDRLGVSSRQGDGRVFHWHLPNPVIDRFLDSTGHEP